ncbi:YutD family protein [Enterococcus gallinarum]|uniref:YutD family protein n=1 Tax=Enterococcus gallinarum TaxID=1353 RepID=UPI00288F6A44|nr:YutD family protein [Enterococcus gallinarum]MDT2701271.1 YutD family protein [Enterococcus gallinarum]
MTEKQTITDEITSVLEEIIEEPEKQPQKGELVTLVNEDELLIGTRQYKLVVDYREGFDPQKLGERYSEVLARYDYIVGDWGYEQLRLKGFFDKDNRKALPDQRIDMLEDYLYEYCNFGCAYFVIQRVGGKKEKSTTRRRKKKPAAQSNQTRPAHIDEKQEVVSQKQVKPTIKNRKPKEKKARSTETKVKKTNKKEFTIRQREE